MINEKKNWVGVRENPIENAYFFKYSYKAFILFKNKKVLKYMCRFLLQSKQRSYSHITYLLNSTILKWGHLSNVLKKYIYRGMICCQILSHHKMHNIIDVYKKI